MASSLPGNTPQTARLIAGAPGFAVGWQEPVYVPAPAPGAQWVYKVDGRFTERVLSIRMVLTTSAVVANRFPRVQVTDHNGTVVISSLAGQSVAANSSLISNLFTGSSDNANGGAGDTFGDIPSLLIPPGWSWGSTVASMDAADQLSGIVLLVQRYPNDTAVMPVTG